MQKKEKKPKKDKEPKDEPEEIQPAVDQVQRFAYSTTRCRALAAAMLQVERPYPALLLPPKKETALKHTIAIMASNRAYSTSPAPWSSRNREAMCRNIVPVLFLPSVIPSSIGAIP